MRSAPFNFLIPVKAGRMILVLSLVVFFFWGIVFLLKDVYQYPVVGVVAELLWIPMILFLVFLPVISIIRIFLKGAESRMLSILSLLVGIGSLLLIFIRK